MSEIKIPAVTLLGFIVGSTLWSLAIWMLAGENVCSRRCQPDSLFMFALLSAVLVIPAWLAAALSSGVLNALSSSALKHIRLVNAQAIKVIVGVAALSVSLYFAEPYITAKLDDHPDIDWTGVDLPVAKKSADGIDWTGVDFSALDDYIDRRDNYVKGTGHTDGSADR
tara:strand:+ start:126 stop:629 length:504 start_codon:yes stop_codon:yes gene_type:complete